MRSIEEHCCRSGRDAVLHADCVRNSNRNVSEPVAITKRGLWPALFAVVTVTNDTVANHRAAKQFHCRVLFRQGKVCQSGTLRYLRHDATVNRVRCLSHPAAECEPSFLEELKQLRHRVGTIMWVQQSISKSGFILEIWGLRKQGLQRMVSRQHRESGC